MGFRDFIKDKVQETTKSSSQQQPVSGNAPTRSSKRGLCWPVENQDPVHTFTKPNSKISWLYNWSPNPTPNCSSLEFVPMQWNNVGIDDLPKKLEDANARSVLYFNEPELPDQSNMSVDLAAREWIRCIEPLRKRGFRCGSPGISNAGHAIPYLQNFLQKIRERGSDIDFLCIHWYGDSLGGFYDYIWSTHHQLDASKPVWITEFACTNWNLENPLPREQVEEFARESCKYLDGLEWVERYCWVGAMRDMGTVGVGARMLDEEGRLTGLGRGYRDV